MFREKRLLVETVWLCSTLCLKGGPQMAPRCPPDVPRCSQMRPRKGAGAMPFPGRGHGVACPVLIDASCGFPLLPISSRCFPVASRGSPLLPSLPRGSAFMIAQVRPGGPQMAP